MSEPDPAPSSSGERLDAISGALAKLVVEQRQLAARQEEILVRLARLEVHLEARPEESPVTPAPLVMAHHVSPPPLPAFPAEPAPPPLPLSPTPAEPLLETRLGLNWLNRVAVITLIFGVAFFFKYAIDNQWIGPSARVALGLVAAMMSLAAGEWMYIRAQNAFAQGLTGLGIALLYLSFYATFGFYHLLSQEIAFALMFLTTLAGGFLALHYGSQTVAVLALSGGFLTPVLLSTGENRLGVLAAYTLLLNLGASALLVRRRWNACAYLALLATWGLFLVWSSEWLNDDTRLAAFAWISITFLVFFVASAVSQNMLLLLPNVALYFSVSYFLLDPRYHDWLGAYAVLAGVLHGLLAAREWHRDRNFAQLSSAIALTCFTLAFPIQFTGFRITMAWALEGAALAWLARRYATDKGQIASWCVLALVGLRLAIFDAEIFRSAQLYELFFNRRFLTFAVSAASLWLAARFTQTKPAQLILNGAGHLILLWGLALEADGWAFRNFSATDALSVSALAISILGGLYALSLVTAGVILHGAFDRQLGLALIGLCIAKLYLYDIWTLSRGFRIAAFLGLGALLLLVSYLYSRFKPALERLWRQESEPVDGTALETASPQTAAQEPLQ